MNQVRVWVGVAVAIFLARDVFAQCRVQGTVRGIDGQPLAAATIRVLSPDLKAPLTTTTDDRGRYAVDSVKPGIYVEVVAVQGGRPVAHGFSLVTLFVETVDLRVEPESTTPLGADSLDPEGGPSASIRGVVRGADGTGVAGARVTITDTMVSATTDAAGRYAFVGVRSGLALELSASANGFATAESQVTVPTSGRADVDFTMSATPSTVFADQALIGTPADGTALVVRPESVAGVPAVDGTDIFRALALLPGSTAALESSANLFVRGSTPDQTLITYDGFTLYPMSRVFGGFSALNMEAIAKADFASNVVDAADGGRLAGALHLTGAANPSTKPSAAFDVSTLGWGAVGTTPLGGRGVILFAGRRSPPTALYNKVLNEFEGRTTLWQRDRTARFSGGTFASSPASSFSDLNGKFEARLTPADRASVTFYDSRDSANQSRNTTFPSSGATFEEAAAFVLPADALAEISDVQTFTGRGLSAVWQRSWSPTTRTTLSVGHSEFSRSGARASILADPLTGQDLSFVAGRGGSDGIAESNTIRDTTVRLVGSFAPGFAHLVTAGGEIASLDAGYTLQSEVLQHAIGVGTMTSRLVDAFDATNTSRVTSVFAQDSWRPLGRLTVSPGLRVTHNTLAGSTDADPRASASLRLWQRMQVTGAWSIDHQAASRIVREDLSRGDGELWTIADGSRVPILRAAQVLVGASVDLPNVVLEAHAYRKTFDNLTMLAPRFLPGTTIAESGSVLHTGSGLAEGVELLVQGRTPLNTVWVGYTLGRVEYTYPTLEAATFPASFDQLHEIKVTDTMRFGRSWSIGGVWVLGSGRPDTPPLGVGQVWLPSGDLTYHVTFGPKNSDRLPPYHRLDLSAQREIRLGALDLTVRGAVFNVYDQQNIASHQYETVVGAASVNDVMLMRRAVNVSLRIGF